MTFLTFLIGFEVLCLFFYIMILFTARSHIMVFMVCNCRATRKGYLRNFLYFFLRLNVPKTGRYG